ncbi:glycosyltransferase family 4 protein [Microbispora amethystogenes]|uniref:glycosyltransferase family 4 protein n=1 Tax=Microbispora amethystogenes TaxID=1427754 RepID=UPI001EF3296F|nr:glycosyltransferase family 4 protein [Microbispora amethystogenes]
MNGTNGVPPRLSGLRVALVNWRDPWHERAGGAEAYAWEIGRRLAEWGAELTFITARGPGQAAAETVEGVRIVRGGGTFTVYARAAAWLWRHRREFDVVIDCQNGIPFFTPLLVPREVRVLCVVHHVHDAQFGVHFPGWLARLGRFLEGPAARRVYRRHLCVAVSPSTVAAMRRRLAWTGPITVVPNGGHPPQRACHERAERPSLVCVGRMVPHKRVELVVGLAETLRAEWPGLTVDLVGRGPELGRLTALVAERGLTHVVRLHGHVPEEEKERLVGRAWAHLSASQGEGWGLSVLEAAALGVPTVAFDVDGLRDAVRDGRTGWLAGEGAAEGRSLAKVTSEALTLLSDPARAAETARECRAWAAGFTWDRSAAMFAELLPDAPRKGR